MACSAAVRFSGLAINPSLEAAVHRWVGRFELMRFSISGADAVIESARRRATRVKLALALANGSTVTTAATHGDPYVAIADAFRAARQRLLAKDTLALR